MTPRECCGTTPDCHHLDDCPRPRRDQSLEVALRGGVRAAAMANA